MIKKILNEVKKYKYKLDLVWFILFPIFNVVYIIANNMYKQGHNLTIALDRQIPLIPIFIIPYVYWYLYMIIGYAVISVRNRQWYMKGLIGLFIGMWISYLIYFIFPTEIVRPVISEGGILNNLINIIYNSDRPFNCFPSLHVLGTYFVMKMTKKENNKGLFIYTQIVGVLIILSTLFIKQHYVLDVVVSIILVEVIMFFMNKVKNDNIDKILNLPYSALVTIKKKYKELQVN